MRRIFIFSLVLLVIFLSSGCKKAKKGLLGKTLLRKEQKVAEVESVELAEAILWPEPYQINFPRDPFKPLIGEQSLLEQKDMEFLGSPEMDIKVFGVLKMEGGSIALLEFYSGVGLVREGDKVGKYTVGRIASDRVVLESEGKIRVLEVGGEE